MFLESPPPNEDRLKAGDTFRFSCHRELSCFNACCRNKHLPLTPYDILRIKINLGIHSDDFLARYVAYRPDPVSGFPILSIKMLPENAVCPFVTPAGCAIYHDRPTACRLYPLGRSSGIDPKESTSKEFYTLLHITHCDGLKEDKVRTVAEWVNDQELLPYIDMNDKMLDILFHPRRDPSTPIAESQQQKVMVACYNLDMFRKFVFETPFLKQFQVDDGTAQRIKTDDAALLIQGFAFLKNALYA
ncbi:MAG: YkgJ family cysteine cluster protein [Deltaproteobacteria bacterium]|nr:YkgJ family cysteine cluster protein [Deltaproteobacteria bacterium]